MKIAFLIHNIYGIGGTNRTTINLATALADRHEVEIVSVFRTGDRSLFDIDPRVRVVSLIDTRTKDDAELRQQPAEIFPRSEARYKQYHRLCDLRAAEYFERAKPDVAIGTRPGLNLYVARLAGEDTIRIGQEHITLESHSDALRAELRAHYGRFDSFVTVSATDAENYRTQMAIPGLEVISIPNSVPAPAVAPADSSSKTVVAAGRLAVVKRYDLLVQAFAQVVLKHPDWRLRIYGTGSQHGKLRGLINELNLYNNVHLMGPASPIEAEWVKGSLAAVTSQSESFGMTIVEAMRCGVPVLSTACPVGPPEIIRHGEDGLLVTPGDVDAIAAGLLELIGDEGLRARMGAAALRNSARYDPAAIADRYDELFERLRSRRGLGQAPARGRRPVLSRLLGLRSAVGRAKEGTGRQSTHINFDALERPAARVGATVYAAASGTITVAVSPDDRAAQGTLLLVRRDGQERDKRETVRVPLGQDADGRWSARVAPDLALAEDFWDFYLESAKGKRKRLHSDLLDLRELVGLRPASGPGPVVHRLPYKTVDGYAALRVWQRAAHAEAEAIEVSAGAITVSGRMYGTTPGGRLTAELRRREGEPLSLPLPCTALPGGRFELTAACYRPAAERVGEHDLWDVFVHAEEHAEPIRVARYFDDLRERKLSHVYPITVIEETSRGRARVRPFYSVHNELSINVVDLPPEE